MIDDYRAIVSTGRFWAVQPVPCQEQRCGRNEEVQQRIPQQSSGHGYDLVGEYQTGEEYARS